MSEKYSSHRFFTMGKKEKKEHSKNNIGGRGKTFVLLRLPALARWDGSWKTEEFEGLQKCELEKGGCKKVQETMPGTDTGQTASHHSLLLSGVRYSSHSHTLKAKIFTFPQFTLYFEKAVIDSQFFFSFQPHLSALYYVETNKFMRTSLTKPCIF